MIPLPPKLAVWEALTLIATLAFVWAVVVTAGIYGQWRAK